MRWQRRGADKIENCYNTAAILKVVVIIFNIIEVAPFGFESE